MEAQEARFPDRYESIEGIVYDMSPPPSESHQRTVWNLSRLIGNYLEGKPCRAYNAPFGVWFQAQDEEHVEPDILVVCDPSKIHERGCVGAPDWIVEVLSPATATKDRTVKLRRYQKAGVHEYWILDPLHHTLEVFHLDNGVYKFPATYGEEDTATVGIFEDLRIPMREVFR